MKLKHLLLYSKGWYRQSGNFFNDLKIVLQLDDYEPYSNNDVLAIILNNLPSIREFDLSVVIPAIRPYNCWKFGYVIKGDYFLGDEQYAVEYDYDTAILKYILSNIAHLEKSHYGDLPKPNYKTGLTRPKDISLKEIKEKWPD